MSDEAKAASNTMQGARGGGLTRAVITGIVSGSIVLVFVKPFLGFLWRFVLSNICGVMVFAYFGRAARGESAEEFERSFAHIVYQFVTSRLVTTLFFVLVMLTATYGGSKEYLAMQLKASFHQRLGALAPRISEQEYKELLASWANMRTQEDYRRIVAAMEAEAQRAGVSLPKLLSGAAP